MEPNLLTQGRKALIERLSSIAPANGYRTNLGLNVRYGWLSDILQEHRTPLPLIVVQKGKDLPPVSRGGDLKKHSCFRVIAALDPGAQEEALDDAELDLIQCLMPTEGVPLDWTPRGIPQLTIGESERFPPGDGMAAATLLIPIYLHIFVRGR